MVIPAEAEIQTVRPCHWIPAFAGMTRKDFEEKSTCVDTCN
jgi:hypothetical protein